MTDTTDSSPLTPNQARWLKIAVVVMGIMIVVGVAILIGRILYLASQGPRQAATMRAPSPIPMDGRLALPAGAVIKSLSLAGDRLAIHYDAPTGTGIAIIDTTTGTRLSHIDVLPSPPGPGATPR